MYVPDKGKHMEEPLDTGCDVWTIATDIPAALVQTVKAERPWPLTLYIDDYYWRRQDNRRIRRFSTVTGCKRVYLPKGETMLVHTGSVKLSYRNWRTQLQCQVVWQRGINQYSAILAWNGDWQPCSLEYWQDAKGKSPTSTAWYPLHMAELMPYHRHKSRKH